MFKKIENKKGVTLVELLAVVVIMGIIAAIAVPTVGGLIQAQRDNAAEESWNQVKEAAKLYATSEEDTTVSLADLIAQEYISFDAGTYTLSKGATAAAATDILVADWGTVILEVAGQTVSIEIGTPATNLYVNDVLVGADAD